MVFDCSSKIKTSLKNNITKYPIEDKANISDHVFSENDEFSLTGIVTNSPNWIYPNNQFLPNPQGVKAKRTKVAIQTLRALKESRTPFTLITEFEILENCLIKSLEWEQDAQNSEALTFEIGVEKVRLVKLSTTTVNVQNVASSSKASTKKGEAGKNAESDAHEPKSQGEKQKSTFDKISEKFNALVEKANSY